MLTLTKHHGLGNDFLVLLDLDDRHVLDEDLARALCDRHRGIGADGVIRVGPPCGGADVSMELRNADGSPAEMSGNGIRCLAQAVVEAGLVSGPEFTVMTAAGLRAVAVRPGPDAATDGATVAVSVDLGPATVSEADASALGLVGVDAKRAARVGMGNPHLVLWVPDLTSIDLEATGADLQRRWPGGVNVEAITAGPGADVLSMAVFERGVGLTEACGTGAGAAAAAAHRWGLVGERARVVMPGGEVEVTLGDRLTLVGPAVRIARVEFPWS